MTTKLASKAAPAVVPMTAPEGRDTEDVVGLVEWSSSVRATVRHTGPIEVRGLRVKDVPRRPLPISVETRVVQEGGRREDRRKADGD